MPVALDLTDRNNRDGLPRVIGITFSSLCIRFLSIAVQRRYVTPAVANFSRRSAVCKRQAALRPHRLITLLASTCKQVRQTSRRHALQKQTTGSDSHDSA